MEESSQDQVNPSTTEPESTGTEVPQWQKQITSKTPQGRRKGRATKWQERPIAKRRYKGVIIAVKVSVYSSDESLVTALVKISLESTMIALLELSQGFATNEDAEAYGFEMGKWWIEERR